MFFFPFAAHVSTFSAIVEEGVIGKIAATSVKAYDAYAAAVLPSITTYFFFCISFYVLSGMLPFSASQMCPSAGSFFRRGYQRDLFLPDLRSVSFHIRICSFDVVTDALDCLLQVCVRVCEYQTKIAFTHPAKGGTRHTHNARVYQKLLRKFL